MHRPGSRGGRRGQVLVAFLALPLTTTLVVASAPAAVSAPGLRKVDRT